MRTITKILTFSMIILSNFGWGQNSLLLNGPVNYVRVGDLDVAGDQLTVEALIHYTGASVNIVSKHTNPGNVNYLLRIGSFEITTTSGFANFGGVAAAGVTLNPGNTYHVAATYNGQFLRYYVNGCLTGEMAWTGNMILNDFQTAIGNQSSSETEQFNGFIDEVRIWNVARTQAQIGANMLNLPNPAGETGLMGYWKFDNNLTNTQGNPAFNGVAVGAPQFQRIPYPYPTLLGVTATSSPVVCEGSPTGHIDIAGNGGYVPYSYSIDGVNYQASPSFPDVVPGTYTVYARSNANCIATTNVTVNDNPELLANLQVNDATCNGSDNGSALINPSGGNGPGFNWTWSNGNQTDLTLSNLPPGNYDVDIADSCKHSGPELVVNGHFENGNTGFTSDYSYCTNCFNGSNDLPGGNYVIGTNANQHHNGFQGVANGGQGYFMIINGAAVPNTNVWCQTITVNPNTYYVFSSWVSSVHPNSPAQLNFSANGAALGPVFSATGATNTWSQFFSTWFSGANTSVTICIVNQNTTPAGNDFALDDISFKECVSCVETFPFEIAEPAPLTIDIVSNNETCNTGNGSITATANGGVSPYTYALNGNPTGANGSYTNLTSGTYSVSVLDDNSCTESVDNIILDNTNTDIEATISSLPNSSCLQCNYDGPSIMINEINIYPLIGDGSIFGPGPNNPSEGEWIELYNPNWCDTVDISGYFLGSFNSAGNAVTVPMQSNGMAFVLPEGTKVPPLGFVVVRGINAPAPPVGVIDIVVNNDNNNACIDGGIGQSRIWFQNSGGWFAFYDADGIPQDVISWGIPVQTDLDGNPCIPTANNLPPSVTQLPSYNASGIGVNLGNSVQSGTFVRIPDGGDWSPTPSTENFSYGTCNDPDDCLAESGISFCNGQATVNITSGVGPFTYLWDDPADQTGETAFNLCAGEYTVTVTDANGCTESYTVTIEDDLFTISVTSENPDCEQTNGSISVTTDGDGDFTYIWSENTGIADDQTTSVDNLGGGVYSVSVTGGGCTRDSTIVLIAPEPIDAVNLNVSPTTCGTSNGAIQIDNVTGGTVPFVYNFNNQGPTTDTLYTNLPPGVYSIFLTDGQGCTYLVENVAVDGSVGISGALADVTAATCGQADGSIQIVGIQDGNPPFVYSLSGVAEPSGEFNDLIAGNYTLLVTDDDNCTFQQVIVLPLAQASDAIFVPNVITPNGDGSNEVWFIAAECVEKFQCTILNRWGNILYTYDDINSGWPGTTMDGTPVLDGVYFYKSFLEFYSGRKEELQGFITVIR
jgi:gliding motility-associated-like protein